jgi:hypothetical protein
MTNNLSLLLQQRIGEQIGIEEQLCRVIAQQLLELENTPFAEARDLLRQTQQLLEEQFAPLNQLLDRLEQDAVRARELEITTNGSALISGSATYKKKWLPISQMLRDDYSALNLITISNTLLHTIALALDSSEVASLALKHLQDLAPLVIKIGAQVPEVVALELQAETGTIDLSVAQKALSNTRQAWQNAA